MKDKSNKTAELPQITLNRYHKKIAVFSTIGGLLWTLYSLIDSVLLDIKDNEILHYYRPLNINDCEDYNYEIK